MGGSPSGDGVPEVDVACKLAAGQKALQRAAICLSVLFMPGWFPDSGPTQASCSEGPRLSLMLWS